MDLLKDKIKDVTNGIYLVIRDDATRKELMFKWLNVLLAFVSFFMTVVNIFTQEYILMISTLAFSIACIVNLLLMRKRINIIYIIFVIESLILLAFFFISGIPNGFSALWVCLIPSFSLLIFGINSGTKYSFITFLMLLFFFWFPFGKQLLLYQYTNEFMLRFPFLYIACYIIALLVEIVRAQTQKQLLESEQKYFYLYRHDALTGLYNRYGFNAVIDTDYKVTKAEKVAILILDVDDFKHINDQYGHDNGDIVLQGIAEIMRKSFCEQTCYCRWGGEEFTAYFHCEHDYKEIAEKLRSNVEETEFRSGDLVMKVTISIGLCISNTMENVNIATLINKADQCLYKAKDKGKNCVVSIEI